MSDFLRPIERREVVNPKTFGAYCNQMLGTKWLSTVKDLIALGKELKDFFAARPQATYGTLLRTVDWMRAKKKRVCYAKAVIKFVNMAYVDGMLPELDVTYVARDDTLEGRIERALEVEVDASWRRMLVGCDGVENRRNVYAGWVTYRKELTNA